MRSFKGSLQVLTGIKTGITRNREVAEKIGKDLRYGKGGLNHEICYRIHHWADCWLRSAGRGGAQEERLRPLAHSGSARTIEPGEIETTVAGLSGFDLRQY